MSKKLWFKRKRYGWGWVPVTWQGWLATLAYVVAIVSVAHWPSDSNPTMEQIIFNFALPLGAFTAVFIWVAYKKGEKPRWQWGND